MFFNAAIMIDAKQALTRRDNLIRGNHIISSELYILLAVVLAMDQF